MSGCSGKMGASIISAASMRSDCVVAAGVDIVAPSDAGFVYAGSFDQLDCEADVIVDFSNPVVLDSMLDYALHHRIPAVICTTGYSEEQKKKISL